MQNVVPATLTKSIKDFQTIVLSATPFRNSRVFQALIIIKRPFRIAAIVTRLSHGQSDAGAEFTHEKSFTPHHFLSRHLRN
jgi:hypothetical protein